VDKETTLGDLLMGYKEQQAERVKKALSQDFGPQIKQIVDSRPRGCIKTSTFYTSATRILTYGFVDERTSIPFHIDFALNIPLAYIGQRTVKYSDHRDDFWTLQDVLGGIIDQIEGDEDDYFHLG
jgi:hypothetical protein